MSESRSFWSRLTSPLRRGGGALSAQNALRRDDPLRYLQILAHIQPSGIVVTMDSALELSAVWACVQAITNGISSCSWNVLTQKGDRRELLLDDPLYYILNTRPNPDMTAVAFREAMMFNVLTWGNATRRSSVTWPDASRRCGRSCRTAWWFAATSRRASCTTTTTSRTAGW
jgi:hypothetical protein